MSSQVVPKLKQGPKVYFFPPNNVMHLPAQHVILDNFEPNPQ